MNIQDIHHRKHHGIYRNVIIILHQLTCIDDKYIALKKLQGIELNAFISFNLSTNKVTKQLTKYTYFPQVNLIQNPLEICQTTNWSKPLSWQNKMANFFNPICRKLTNHKICLAEGICTNQKSIIHHLIKLKAHEQKYNL